MLNPKRSIFICCLTLGIVPYLLLAQGAGQVRTPGVTQELLVSSALSQFPGKEITVFTGRFEPGSATPLHKHPGTEILYVLEGNGEMQIAGQETKVLSPGTAVLVQPTAGEDHFIHRAANSSASSAMKTLVIVIHDSDTPPALPVDSSNPPDPR